MNVLLRLAFHGTNYHGFQVQKNALAVCEVVQNAMETVFGSRPQVKGSSRTDAGVHARGFALSFHTGGGIPVEKIPLALNAYLPQDIRVRGAVPVAEDFHARYSATGKEYSYTLLNSEFDDPLQEGLYHRMGGKLDEQAMQTVANVLLGKHDFSAFCASGAKEGDRVRTLHRLDVQRQGQWLEVRAAADGFLYNMVRIVAGTLVQAGKGRMSAEEAAAVLDSCDRGAAGPTLPAEGLCLEKVFYPEALVDPNFFEA